MANEQTGEPEELLQLWREQRAYRVGRKLSYAGAVLSFLAFFVDLQFSPAIVAYFDVILFAGCILSILWSRDTARPYFCWWPMIVGFWLSTLPSLYATGGLHSPFLGFDLATVMVCTLIVQNQVKPIYVVVFTFSHLLVLYGLEFFVELPVYETPGLFVASVAVVTLAALVVCIYELLNAEEGLSGEFAQRYRELKDTKADLHREEAANQAKSAFLANVSHELRTPLAAIVGYSELLQTGDFSESERVLHCETIRRNGEQLAKLVDDLLDLSKVEAGKVEVFAQQVRLAEILVEVLALINLSARKKHLPIEIEYSGKVPTFLHCDPTRLKQILLNVLGNAVKFTDQGCVSLTVSCRSEDGRDVLNFIVRDSGRGISDSERELLFRPFSQGDHVSSHRYGGTGLGLSLSRKLARLLGGDLVLARSQPGRGSEFCLTVPVGAVERQTWINDFTCDFTCGVRGEAGAKDPGQQVLRGQRVLVIDDSDDNLVLIRLMLESAGAKVETASNAMDGIGRALAENFSAVLMDIQMPVMDGFEATLTLRSRGYKKPILALTANARNDDRNRCLAVGCNDHLTKPISSVALVEALAEATGVFRARMPLECESGTGPLECT